MKFLIAMTAYAALVCHVCFTRWSRRVAFFVFALVAAVVANGMRAAGTIVIAHLFGLEWAVGFDHIVYGWVFFGLVIVGVMAAAWPFFDRPPGAPFFDPDRLKGRIWGGGALPAVALAAAALSFAGPLWSYAVAAGGDRVNAAFTAPDVPGWRRIDTPPALAWSPHFAGADHVVHARYANDAGDAVDLVVVAFNRQAEGSELVGFGQGSVGPDSPWAWARPGAAPDDGFGEVIAGPGPTLRHVVSFYVIDGIVTGSARQVKLATLKLRLLGGDQRAAAILVSGEMDPLTGDHRALEKFVSDLGSVKSLADRATGIR